MRQTEPLGCRDCASGWVYTKDLEVPQEDGSVRTYEQVRGCPRCRPNWQHPDDKPQQEATRPDGWWKDK